MRGGLKALQNINRAAISRIEGACFLSLMLHTTIPKIHYMGLIQISITIELYPSAHKFIILQLFTNQYTYPLHTHLSHLIPSSNNKHQHASLFCRRNFNDSYGSSNCKSILCACICMVIIDYEIMFYMLALISFFCSVACLLSDHRPVPVRAVKTTRSFGNESLGYPHR